MASDTRDRLERKLEKLKKEAAAIELKLNSPPSHKDYLHDRAVNPETSRETVNSVLNTQGIDGDVNKAASFLGVPVSYIHQNREKNS